MSQFSEIIILNNRLEVGLLKEEGYRIIPPGHDKYQRLHSDDTKCAMIGDMYGPVNHFVRDVGQ